MNSKTKLLILWAAILLAAAACSPGGDEVPVAEPTSAPVAAVEPTEPPAVEPTPLPTEPPAEPTEVPPPTAEPTDEPAVEPAAERLGVLRFRDGADVPSGSFQLLIEGIAPPAAGTHYEAWLVDDRFNTLNLGIVEVVDGNVTFEGSVDKNLLVTYSGAFISLEPDGVDDGEIGPVALAGPIPAGSLLHIRHVIIAFGGNPDGKAFLVGAEEQLHHAMEHTGFLQEELAADNIREAQRHAEHVINILDGETGANFGDLDGDSVIQNPGDGVGVRGYFEGAKQHTNLATDAEDVTAEVELHAGHVLISSDNALGRIDEAIGEAMRIIASDSAAEAQPAADKLTALLEAAMNGVDANGDGAIAPIPNEGGLVTAYVHAQNMATVELLATDGAAVAAPAPAEVVEDVAEEVVEEVAATPTAAPPPPAPPAPVAVDMANFAFAPSDLTIPVGTEVTWVNKDSGPRHSATAADGSFDTGLFDGGDEATITFDTPGTFVYYCLLHGSPDGSGMAATITVTEE